MSWQACLACHRLGLVGSPLWVLVHARYHTSASVHTISGVPFGSMRKAPESASPAAMVLSGGSEIRKWRPQGTPSQFIY